MNSSYRQIGLFLILTLSNHFVFGEVRSPETTLSEQNLQNRSGIFLTNEEAHERIRDLETDVSDSAFEDREVKLVQLGKALYNYNEQFSLTPDESSSILYQAIEAYIEAAHIAIDNGLIRHTLKISDIATKLGDKQLLDDIFNELLEFEDDEGGKYGALIYYTNALAGFNDESAKEYYKIAISMRNTEDGRQAYYTYARYLYDSGDLEGALEILGEFSAEQRQLYWQATQLQQRISHELGLDTREIDQEINDIRERLKGAIGIGDFPKINALETTDLKNRPNLPEAHAIETFSHTKNSDDSRGSNANNWKTSPT